MGYYMFINGKIHISVSNTAKNLQVHKIYLCVQSG